MKVRKLVNFNGHLVMTTGIVTCLLAGSYIVKFSHDGVEFAGEWKCDECEVC